MKRLFLIKLIVIMLLPAFHSCVLNDMNAPCQITGKITDSAGKGIQDVSIKYTLKSSEQNTTTSADGTYTLKIPSGGPVIIKYSKEEFISQTSSFAMAGGEKKVLDISMKKLSEEAYLNLDFRNKTIYNNGETFTAMIRANVSYEFTSTAPWITCTKSSSGITVVCNENESTQERVAIITFKGDYNLTDTLTIKQLTGPVLKVVDFLGKNTTNSPDIRPYVTFSAEISALAAQSSGVNLLYTLSADRKTIYFNSFKLNIFASNPIQLTVKAADNIPLFFNLDLKIYVNSQSIPPANGQTMYFTNDNKYAWIFTITGSNRSLRQFTTSDFKEVNQISSPSYGVYYNPYNNSFYIISQIPFEDRYINEIKIYDAATAAYKDKFTIDNNGEYINELEFSDNGFGIMILGTKLYYLDTSNNNKWGLFSDNAVLYDPHQVNWLLVNKIEMCNNNKTFVLFGQDTSGAHYGFRINAATKELAFIYKTTMLSNIVTSNSGTGVLYFSRYSSTITYQDVLTKSIKNFTLPYSGTGNLAILATDNAYPDILTSDMSVISGSDNAFHSFTHQGEYYYLKSSNDGKLIMINNNGFVYLMRSEIFTKYINSIQ